jgi:hypothetical protein
MTKPKFDRDAFEKRHQQMRMNAGDWLLKNRDALKLCQGVLVEKHYGAWEDLNPQKDSSLACHLQEVDDAVDLLARVIAELRNTDFWPEPETV